MSAADAHKYLDRINARLIELRVHAQSSAPASVTSVLKNCRNARNVCVTLVRCQKCQLMNEQVLNGAISGMLPKFEVIVCEFACEDQGLTFA